MFKKICFIEIIFMILFLAIKGTIKNFVSPMIVILLYISLPIIILFLIIDFIKKAGKIKLSFLFILPIIFVICGSKGVFSETYMNARVNNNYAINNIKSEKKVEIKNDEESSKYQLNGMVIDVNDKNYIQVIDNIYADIDKYLGAKVLIEGCVFRNPDTMLKNQFAAGKYYMYCCALDLSLTGFLFEYDNYSEVQNGKWYKFEAIVDKHEVNDRFYGKYLEPMLKVISKEEIPQPKNTKVY